MDPLSIMASVTGLLGATAKVSKSLIWLTSSIKDAPATAHSTLTEVEAFRSALVSLQRYLIAVTEGPTESRRAAFIQLDQFIAVLTDAVLTFSDLETLVCSSTEATAGRRFTGLGARAKLVWNHDEITTAVGKLQRHKASLSLMLNIVQCETDVEAYRSVVNLQTMVEQLLESNVKLCHRLKHLEDAFDAKSLLPPEHENSHGLSMLHPSDAVTSFRGGTSMADVMSVISSRRRIDFHALDITPSQTSPPPYFSFEEELKSSRVYKRTRFFYPTDRDTTISTAIRTHAWSVFSGLSLADISVVSAIALPLFPADISNSEHYVFTSKGVNESPYPWSRRNFQVVAPKGEEQHTGIKNNRSLFPRYGPAVTPGATSSGHAYLMGGLMDESRVLADLWYIEVQGSSDLRCVPIAASGRKPSARVGHRCVLAGNALCLHGGDTKMEDSDTLDDNLYLMNRETCQWHVAPVSSEPGVSPPPGRYGHSLSLVASFLVVFGGQIEGDFRNDTALFDLELLQWVEPRLADNDKLPPPPRTNHSTVVWDNKMYIFGGTNGHTWYNDIWSYDPVTNTWEYVATDTRHWKRPARREGHSAAVTGGMMCVFGGRSEMGRDLPDFWVFDLAERRWHPFGNMGGVPSPRSGHSMVVFGKHIVVVAGEPSSSTPQADREELALGYVLDTTKIRIPKTSLVVSHPSPGLNGLEIPPGLMF